MMKMMKNGYFPNKCGKEDFSLVRMTKISYFESKNNAGIS